jgi:hypothetical protein
LDKLRARGLTQAANYLHSQIWALTTYDQQRFCGIK